MIDREHVNPCEEPHTLAAGRVMMGAPAAGPPTPRKRYTYHVVSANGHGIHGPEYERCSDARKAAERIAENERTHRVKLGPYEIERVEHVGYSGHRYWLRKRQRWVLWQGGVDMDARQPDWRYGG